MTEVFISGKPFSAFSADDFHQHVVGMFALPRKKGGKPVSPAPGLSVSRTKKGAISIRHSKKLRAFAYVTSKEVELLAKELSCGQAELWNVFKKKKFIFAQNRIDAEKIYADINDIPW